MLQSNPCISMYLFGQHGALLDDVALSCGKSLVRFTFFASWPALFQEQPILTIFTWWTFCSGWEPGPALGTEANLTLWKTMALKHHMMLYDLECEISGQCFLSITIPTKLFASLTEFDPFGLKTFGNSWRATWLKNVIPKLAEHSTGRSRW